VEQQKAPPPPPAVHSRYADEAKASVQQEAPQEEEEEQTSASKKVTVRGETHWALSDVWIAEKLASLTTYYEVQVDDGPRLKQKNSGLIVSSGGGGGGDARPNWWAIKL
jgi:hypothetical protein